MRQRAKTHRIQQQAALAAGGAGSARAGVAGSPGSPAARHPIAGMALQGNLLLLSEDLDLGGGEAKRGIGDRCCCGHLVPAETCSGVYEAPIKLEGRPNGPQVMVDGGGVGKDGAQFRECGSSGS